MEISDLWKRATHYSVLHAALLISGHDPEDFEDTHPVNIGSNARGYVPIRTDLVRAIENETLVASKIVYDETEFSGAPKINLNLTIVSAENLDRFVKARRIECDVFERAEYEQRSASNPAGEFFSPKLNAANRAWAAVTSDPARLRGKSPKQALTQWLEEHAIELGLVKSDGSINRAGIEEVSKVANWKPEGGATATPSATSAVAVQAPVLVPPTPSISPRKAKPRESLSDDLDDEMPF